MTWRLVLLLLILSARSWACVCSANWLSVKQAWKEAPAVFLGTVALADPDDPDEDGGQLMFQEQTVRIHVDEAFKGVFPGQTIELHQDANDCSAKFRTGQRAVFYMYPGVTRGSWSVPPCTRTLGSAEPAGDDLLFLRGLPKSALGTRLSGAIELYEDSPVQAFKRVAGVPNVRVSISGPLGVTREVVTNINGVYELYDLRPGTYSVSIVVPNGLRIKFPVVTGSAPVRGSDASVELDRDGGASVDFVLQADTQLSGRVLDAKGAPTTGVCVDLEPLEGRGVNGARFFDCTKAGGTFTMAMMPPGKYWLVARDEVRRDGLKSESTLFYPGVRDRRLATIISIETGNYVQHLDMRLPSDEKRYKIVGRFQFVDGAPVASATVRFTSPQSGYSETTNTRSDGSFGLSVMAGMKGQLGGHIGLLEPILRSGPEFQVEPRRSGLIRFMDADPIPLSVDTDNVDVMLELASPSCKSWPPNRE
jgi:hypothetical protein